MPGLFKLTVPPTPIPNPAVARDFAWLKECDYRLCESLQQLHDYIGPTLDQRSPIGLDWETTSLNHYDKSLYPVGLCLSRAPKSGLYVPVMHLVEPERNLPLDGVMEVLQLIDARGIPGIWFNYRYDGEAMAWSPALAKFLHWEPTHWEDALLGNWLVDSNQLQFALKPVIARLYGVKMIDYPGELHTMAPQDVMPYGCSDADWARRLWFREETQAAVKDQRFIYQLEKLVIAPIRAGVRDGCFLDGGYLQTLSADLGAEVKVNGKVLKPATGRCATLQKEIYTYFGKEFNLDSRPQLGENLLALGVPILERTDEGQVATGKDVLQKYAAGYPVISKLIQYYELGTQCRNYINKLAEWVQVNGPHVRFAFNTHGAPTGRMSAGGEGKKGDAYSKGFVDVNIQSIPDHEKQPYLPNIRASILANDPREETDDWVIVAVDFEQVEMRIAGNLSHEPLWVEAFKKGIDIHVQNARVAYTDPTIQKEDPRRKRGKIMGFAILYQASEETVAEHGGISVAEAKTLMENFFRAARRLNMWITAMKEGAPHARLVKSFFGRTRQLGEFFHAKAPRWLQEKGKREAVNDPIQASAADVFKIAVVKTYALVQARGWQDDVKQILWMHDELVFRVRRRRLLEVVPALVTEMEFPVKGWEIPLKAVAEVGWDWGRMRKADTAELARLGREGRVVSWMTHRPVGARAESCIEGA